MADEKFVGRLNNDILEVVGEFKYLGVLLTRSGSFYANKKHLASQAEKAMYSLIKKSRSLLLPVDLQIDLFDKMVKPILLYGSEVWGFGTLDGNFKVHTQYEIEYSKFHGIWRDRFLSYKYRCPMSSNCILG